jgi:hypothetical protein
MESGEPANPLCFPRFTRPLSPGTVLALSRSR